MVDVRKSPFLLSEEQAAWVESTRAGLSIEEKAGQCFCIMGGDYAPDVLKEMVASGKVGGILFRPVVTGEQIKADYAPLPDWQPSAEGPLPLLPEGHNPL